VLVKFLLPEVLWEKAEKLFLRIERGEIRLRAPDLIYPESANILWEKHRKRELDRSEVGQIADLIRSFPLMIEPSKALSSLAVEMGMAYGITAYDSVYLCVARIYENYLITADRRLFERMGKTDLKKYVIWLGDYEG
jgi:predicted nucleic acid-binding protein